MTSITGPPLLEVYWCCAGSRLLSHPALTASNHSPNMSDNRGAGSPSSSQGHLAHVHSILWSGRLHTPTVMMAEDDVVLVPSHCGGPPPLVLQHPVQRLAHSAAASLETNSIPLHLSLILAAVKDA